MPVPTMTHLQFLILDCLMSGKKSGRTVRAALAKQGAKKTGPAFYQLMARMEDAGWVEGWYEQEVIDGQLIKERHYKAIGKGVRAHGSVLEFYSRQASEVKGGLIGV
jgi:hypothetical protein